MAPARHGHSGGWRRLDPDGAVCARQPDVGVRVGDVPPPSAHAVSGDRDRSAGDGLQRANRAPSLRRPGARSGRRHRRARTLGVVVAAGGRGARLGRGDRHGMGGAGSSSGRRHDPVQHGNRRARGSVGSGDHPVGCVGADPRPRLPWHPDVRRGNGAVVRSSDHQDRSGGVPGAVPDVRRRERPSRTSSTTSRCVQGIPPSGRSPMSQRACATSGARCCWRSVRRTRCSTTISPPTWPADSRTRRPIDSPTPTISSWPRPMSSGSPNPGWTISSPADSTIRSRRNRRRPPRRRGLAALRCGLRSLRVVSDDRDAFVDLATAEAVSFATLAARVDSVAAELVRRGLRAG